MMFILGSSMDIPRRALYVSWFAHFDFRKQSGPAFQVICQCTNNAPINVKPHYPPPGLTKGLVGDFRRFDQKFCPTSGAFDRSKF